MRDEDYINLNPLREGQAGRTKRAHLCAALRLIVVLLFFVAVSIIIWSARSAS